MPGGVYWVFELFVDCVQCYRTLNILQMILNYIAIRLDMLLEVLLQAEHLLFDTAALQIIISGNDKSLTQAMVVTLPSWPCRKDTAEKLKCAVFLPGGNNCVNLMSTPNEHPSWSCLIAKVVNNFYCTSYLVFVHQPTEYRAPGILFMVSYFEGGH